MKPVYLRYLAFFAAGMAAGKVVDLIVGSPQYLDGAIFNGIVAGFAYWLSRRYERRETADKEPLE